MEFKDYYKILEISKNSSLEEIKIAYRKASIKWHPDKNAGRDTTLKMQEINEAYLILKDEDARKRYDIEYEKFYNFQKQRNTSQNTSKEYQFEDEVLKRWMNNAKNQSIKIVKEMGILTAKAGKSAISAFFKYVLFSIIFGFIILIIVKGCENKTPTTDNTNYQDTTSFETWATEYDKTHPRDTTTNFENNLVDTTSSIYSSAPETKIYYCVAIFNLKSKYSKASYIGNQVYEDYEYGTKVSDVFEMTDISEDSKYMKLDYFEKKAMDFDTSNEIIGRDIEIFENYATASKRREELLHGIKN